MTLTEDKVPVFKATVRTEAFTRQVIISERRMMKMLLLTGFSQKDIFHVMASWNLTEEEMEMISMWAAENRKLLDFAAFDYRRMYSVKEKKAVP